MREFEGEVKRVTLEAGEKAATTIRYFLISAFSRLVLATPVDTGHARYNWQLSVGARIGAERPGVDKAGQRTIGEGIGKIQAAQPFNNFYMTNNVPYIEVLEYGLFQPADPGPSKDKRDDRFGRILVANGFSTQAPNGMVRVTFQALMRGFKTP